MTEPSTPNGRSGIARAPAPARLARYPKAPRRSGAPRLVLASLAVLTWMACAVAASGGEPERAILAGGCFWCVEADFDTVDGVLDTESGYAFGSEPDRADSRVRVEAVSIAFDPDRITYRQVIDLLFRSVDPTDPGGQFCDRGEKYQTAIIAINDTQREAAIAAAEAAGKLLGVPIVTRILDLEEFRPAAAYHQNFYMRNEQIITRFGFLRKSEAYKRYRKACGRDERVREVWGANAAFAK